MRRHGSKGQIKMDPTGGATTAVLGSMNSWTLDSERDKADATCFGDPNKVYVLGLPDFTGDLGGIWDPAESRKLFDAAFGDVAVMLELIPSTLDPTFMFKGLAYLDAGIEVNADGVITVSGSWAAAAGWAMEPAPA